MSNSDSMSMGGAPSSIGPLLMRRAAPFRISATDIITSEQTLYKDNLFSSVRARLTNLSFAQDNARMSPEFNARTQAVSAQLNQAVTFERPAARGASAGSARRSEP